MPKERGGVAAGTIIEQNKAVFIATIMDWQIADT